MKIAVTSAGGQLGTAIVKELKREIGSENVIGLARTPERASHLGVEIQKGAKIGARCKISSHTFICEGVTIESEVFIGQVFKIRSKSLLNINFHII